MAAKARPPAGSLPTAFLKKTYELVNDQCVDKIISWNADGSTFIIWCPGDLARDLLPQKFKHNKLSSFNRQLNTYGFKKMSPDRWEFAHEFFRRGQEGLLGRINRQKSSPAAAAAANSGKYPIPSSDSNCGLTVLMEENEQLKSEKARLTSENKKLKSVCDSIRHLVSNHSFRGSGSGGKFEAEEAPVITEAEGSRNMDAQMEATLGSEESEFFPGEEELSLRLSLPQLPNKRAWNGHFRPPTSQN